MPCVTLTLARLICRPQLHAVRWQWKWCMGANAAFALGVTCTSATAGLFLAARVRCSRFGSAEVAAVKVQITRTVMYFYILLCFFFMWYRLDASKSFFLGGWLHVIVIPISYRFPLQCGVAVVDKLDWRGERSFYFSCKTVGRSSRRRERLTASLASSRFNNGKLPLNDKSVESFHFNWTSSAP